MVQILKGVLSACKTEQCCNVEKGEEKKKGKDKVTPADKGNRYVKDPLHYTLRGAISFHR